MLINRRSLLKSTAVVLAAPLVLRAHDALASSGSVKVLAWVDYIQPNIAEQFEAETASKNDFIFVRRTVPKAQSFQHRGQSRALSDRIESL